MEIMNTRLPKIQVFTKNELLGVSQRCDWFFYTNNYLQCNFLNTTNTESPKTIFILGQYGHLIVPYFINNYLNKIKNIFNLIIAGEDMTFPKGDCDKRFNHFYYLQGEIKLLLGNTYLNHIFC
jgi:hypothetical protein